MPLDTALATLAQGLRINLDSSGAADRRFVAQLLLPEKQSLTVTDLVTSTEVTPSPVDVGWRTKDVRFGDADIAHDDLVGGMPVSGLLAVNVGSVTEGPTNPPGVPGVVGALAGTVPLPVEVTTPTEFPVTVDVRWRLTDETGRIVSDVDWSLGGAPSFSGAGGEIAPPLGRAMDALTIVFDLLFAELTSNVSPTVRRMVHASVRLEAAGVSSDWIDVPPVDLDLAAIPVPTITIFCQDTDLEYRKLVVVPASSPLDRDTIEQAVATLRDTLDPLQATFGFLALFLDTAGTVVDLLRSSDVTFRKADEIANLNDIDLATGFFGDTEAEDVLSSMILIGPPHRRIECYNARDFDTDEGQMNVATAIELIANVANLHRASPASDPPGRVSVPFPPAGHRWDRFDPWRDIDSFGDEFSSLRFAWET